MWSECYTLAYNNCGPAPWVPAIALIVYRFIAFAFMWALSLYHLITNKEPTLYFFTNWGIFLTCITYTLFVALYLRTWFAKESHLERNRTRFYTPWLLWKWCIFFYETTYSFELLITTFFWSVLFPIMIN
jgi:hypothetical protein